MQASEKEAGRVQWCKLEGEGLQLGECLKRDSVLGDSLKKEGGRDLGESRRTVTPAAFLAGCRLRYLQIISRSSSMYVLVVGFFKEPQISVHTQINSSDLDVSSFRCSKGHMARG